MSQRPSRVVTDKHISDELIIWRERNKIETFRVSLDKFAELIGVPTADIINDIGDIQVIESSQSNISGFIANEVSDYTMEKGDIVTLSEGRNTYSYIYNPIYSEDGQENPGNYALLSYFRSADYIVEIVHDEDELYEAMDRVAEVSAGEILFANDIRLSKDLEAILNNVTLNGNGNTLQMYDGFNNSLKINYNISDDSTSTVFDNIVLQTYPVSYLDSNFDESRTVLEIIDGSDSGGDAVSLTFKSCIFSNCVGFDSGTTSDNHNIVDNRGSSGDLRVIIDGGYTYCSYSSGTSKKLTNYPFTIYKNPAYSDVVNVALKSSDFKIHPEGRWGNVFGLVTGNGEYDTISSDGTFLICKYSADTELGSNTVALSGDSFAIQYNVTSSSINDFYIPAGVYIESINVNTVGPVYDFCIGVGTGVNEQEFYTSKKNIFQDITYLFTSENTSSMSRDLEMSILNNNKYNISASDGVRLSISGTFGTDETFVRIKLRRFLDSLSTETSDEFYSSSADNVTRSFNGITEDGFVANFFPSGYMIDKVYLEETTGNTSDTPIFKDQISAYFMNPAFINTGLQKTFATVNSDVSTPQARFGYTYVNLEYPNLISTAKSFVYTATDWNGSSYNIKFYLKKIL